MLLKIKQQWKHSKLFIGLITHHSQIYGGPQGQRSILKEISCIKTNIKSILLIRNIKFIAPNLNLSHKYKFNTPNSKFITPNLNLSHKI